jgi:uncharacterized protein YbbC (DUF1343 family)
MERRQFFKLIALSSFGAAILPGCVGGGSSGGTSGGSVTSPTNTTLPLGGKILLGIDVLQAESFNRIKGLRCGLVTHRAGVNGTGQRTVDVLFNAPGVKLTKLFGPEHGIDGTIAAEKSIKNAHDKKTGLPIYSLYGATRRPTPAMLSDLDVILIDFQDIGSRSYTYISCMKYVMEVCYSLPQPLKVIVLDRPNPLGGEKVDGPFLDKKWKSYVGAYEMPYVHGLTIGEIARWAVATPGVLELTEGQRKIAQLEVISMRGWRRSMTWNQTGLTWVATSPRIPTPQAALGYAMVGLGCIVGGFSHSFGNQMHFRFIKYSKRKSADIVTALGRSVPGLNLEPKIMSDGTQGVYTQVQNWNQLNPCEISLHMMKQACIWDSTNPFSRTTGNARDLFIKHVGSEAFFEDLRTQGANINLEAWINKWKADANAFRNRTRSYQLYS